MEYLHIVLLLCTLWINVAQLDADNTAEQRLHEDLIKKAGNIDTRPVFNTSETVRVNFGLALIQLYDLDEEKQVLNTQMWDRFLWKNIFLTWDPSEYGGIDHTRIPASKIWRPDVILYNSAFDSYEPLGLGNLNEAMAVVSSDGTVLWIPVARVKSTCSMDMQYFPFDEQTCVLKFGSWTYDGFKLDVDFYDGLEEIDVSDYIQSNMWELVGHPAVKNVKYYPCCEEPYPDLTFKLQLKRIGGYLLYMIVMPAVVISLLLPVVFLLPVGRPEKFILGCSLLMCNIIQTVLVQMEIPRTHSAVPLIEVYYFLNILLTGLTLAISAAILNISRLQSEPPYFLKKVANVLAKCCCMSLPGASYRNFHVSMSSGDDNDNSVCVDPSTGSAKDSVAPEWLVIATVLDRFFLLCSLVISALIVLSLAMHP